MEIGITSNHKGYPFSFAVLHSSSLFQFLFFIILLQDFILFQYINYVDGLIESNYTDFNKNNLYNEKNNIPILCKIDTMKFTFPLTLMK